MNTKKNNFIWFCVVVFAVSILWDILILQTGRVESPFFSFLMWIPGLTAVVFLIVRKEGFRKIGWGVGKWWVLAPAVLVPLSVSLAVAVLLVVLDLGAFVGRVFTFKEGMVEIAAIRLMLGNQAQSIPFFFLNFILSHVFFLIAGSVLTLGEELGWRGYLQEKILRRFGLNGGFLLLGLIWGYWHAPVILMGFNFPDHPVLGALVLMPIGTVFLGIFMGWVYLRSRSIWITALAHASGNLFSGIVFQLVDMKKSDLYQQILWIGFWGLVAIPCLISLHKRKPVFWQGE